MNDQTCKECQHFRQHYTLCEGKLYRVFCVHCTFGRVQTKRPFNKVCDNFVPGSKDTDAYVSKAYLSKKLLEYVLSLKLLPEKIEDLPGTGN